MSETKKKEYGKVLIVFVVLVFVSIVLACCVGSCLPRV